VSLNSKKYFSESATMRKGESVCNVLDPVQMTDFSINLHYLQNILKYDIDVLFHFSLCTDVKSEYSDSFYMSRDPYNKNAITPV
jgi:hypothetical protein